MGQKVNPHGIRVGVIKDWDSRWFASKKDFSDNLVEDHKIRTELKAQLKDAGVPKIEIERTVDPSTSAPRVTVNIYCAKPGMVIGKGGEERVALQNKLTKEYGKTVIVNVIEVKSASTNAQLVAEDIARQLENRVTFRRAMKQCMRNAMSPRDRSTVPAKGIKAMCSGRLGGADIARTESYHEGTIPLQTLRADIDYGFAEAATTYGRIGVKVWVYKGEVLKSAATNAQLVAEDIARQLENRVTFRRAMKQCMRNAMSPRDRSTVPAKGIKAMCSGRLGGADIARTESYHEGTIPLQTLRADIDYGFAEAATTYGRIGVKVWIYKGEVLKSAKNAQKKEGGNK